MTAEDEHKRRDQILSQQLQELSDKIDERFEQIDAKLNPMHEMFSSVSGFNRISVWLLKLLAAIGAAILGLYAILALLKKLGN